MSARVGPTRVGLVQMCSGGDAAANGARAAELIREAAAGGARIVLTPEVTNLIAPDGAALRAAIRPEGEDETLSALRALAAELGVTLLIGSLALRSDVDPERAVNRSFLIAPDGSIVARYDKIHAFRADLPDGETYDEARSYRPGTEAVIADTDLGQIGLTICYDLRFPALYRTLAQAGATILTVPSAFTVPTGRAHWEVLLRARAIECGAWVLAPAQWGAHGGQDASSLRASWGHSLVVSPWGEVLADGGEGEKVVFADLDPDAPAQARARIPAVTGDRAFTLR